MPTTRVGSASHQRGLILFTLTALLTATLTHAGTSIDTLGVEVDTEQQDAERSLAALTEEARHEQREIRAKSRAFLQQAYRGWSRGSDYRYQIVLRLADLYYVESQDAALTSLRAFEERYDACSNNSACDSEALEFDNEESQWWLSRSQRLYSQFLQDHPQSIHADEVTYLLAITLQDLGDEGAAQQELQRLTTAYPESQYVPEALRILDGYSVAAVPNVRNDQPVRRAAPIQ